jgi:exodeoxyribonuclease V beta subunit
VSRAHEVPLDLGAGGAGHPNGAGDVPAFDVCGPLPSGVTVLEASAGTGKTFTIAGLAARYVAEGTPLEHLLLVTFTRMATGELRDRVRRRLVTAEHGLGRALAGVAAPAGDTVLALLATGSHDEVERRRRNLATALADFDAATIATTHGFCQHVLSSLGVAGDVELDVTFTDDVRDLVQEVVDDLYVRRFVASNVTPPFTRSEAQSIGAKAVENPDAVVEPQAAPDDSDKAMRRRLAGAVRAEVERRKRHAAVLTYDDLLTRLRHTLADPDRGAAAGQRLRERYHVALVDEFQDTDPIQWEIMRRVFGDGDATLVLIGDPKQAIYSFRGADIYAYLEAARQARARATLAVNWRSDQALVDAYDALFGGSRLGHADIAYRRVQAARSHQQPGLVDAPEPAALRVRMVHRADGHVRRTPQGYLGAQPAREHIAADLAADVVRLVSSGAHLVERSEQGSETGRVPVRPGHVAVLVARHRDAALVRDALDAAGVPAVVNGAGSVFATEIAGEWLRLLAALERPTAATPAHAAALTVFLGWSAEQVATAGDDAWEALHARLHRWAGVLRRRGVASLLETVTLAEGLPGRMLSQVDGERRLTDLRHVGQLLHAQATSEQLGVTALTGWLRQRIADAAGERDAEDRARRLESDAEAVQVMTVHRAKGLEFPVVYCPYLWDPGWIPDKEPPVYHDERAGDRRAIDVGGTGQGRSWRKHVVERRGEELRLAYVALTRARHQAVVWWAASWDSRDSALCRLLFLRDADGNVPVDGDAPPEDDEAEARFRALAEQAPGCISVERSDGGDGVVWAGEARAPSALAARRFRRRLDTDWRRTSYSGITAGAHEDRVASEAEDAVVSDEEGVGAGGVAGLAPVTGAALDPDAGDEERRLRSVPSLLGAMPGGAEVGTLVHGVLEDVDFAADDLDAELARHVARQRARRHLDVGDPAAVVAGLRAAIDTPLGPVVGEARLRDVGRADRVDELGFELPLAGGDAPTAEVSMDAFAAVLAEHVPPGDVLAGYAERLGDPSLERRLRGYLSGSLDLVLRVPGGAGAGNAGGHGTPRFAVVDYKTNWLGGGGEPLSAWHYRPEAVMQAMFRSHYPLQALLYSVALHRYLRWRLPGYDPERNLAGVLYLFVRGMVGAGTPRVGEQPCGVFAWRPPAGLVEALSGLLDRGRPAR